MQFPTLGDTVPDVLAIVMMVLSLLALLISARISTWTRRLAETNRVKRELKQARYEQLIRHHVLLYRRKNVRRRCIRRGAWPLLQNSNKISW
jgi:hypothetical protein